MTPEEYRRQQLGQGQPAPTDGSAPAAPAPPPVAVAPPPAGQGPPAAAPPQAAPPPPATAPAAPPAQGSWWNFFTRPAADQPASFTQDSSGLGQASIFEKPANASMQDYLLAHLAEASKGAGQIGQAGEDYARVAANTYGLGDRALAAITGTDLATERARTQQASERLGPEGSFAANLTGGGPLGRVASAAGLGTGTLSLAGQGAASGAVGALGRGDDPYSAAGWGAAGGVGASLLGSALSPVARRIASSSGQTPEAATAAAAGAAQQAEQQAGKISYPRSDLGFSAGTGTSDQTVADLLNTREWLKNVDPATDISGAGPVIIRKIDKALAEGTPIGGAPGSGQSAVDALSAARQQAQGAGQLQQWSQQAGWPGPEIRAEAAKAAQAATPGSPEAAAYANIAAAPKAGGGGFYEKAIQPALATGGSLLGGYFLPGVGHVVGAGVGSQLGEWGSRFLPSTQPLNEAIVRAWQPVAGQTTGAAQGLTAQDDFRRALQTLVYDQAGKSPSQAGVARPSWLDKGIPF